MAKKNTTTSRNDMLRAVYKAEIVIKEARFDKKTEKEILENLKKIRNILYI